MIKLTTKFILCCLTIGALAIGCLYFSLLATFDHLNSDYASYAIWYGELRPFNWASCNGFEPIFCILGLIYQSVELPFSYFVFSTSMAIYAILHLAVYKAYKKNDLSNIIFYAATCLLIYVVFQPQMVSHLIRQYLATSLLMLALMSAGGVRVLYTFLAIGFHFTVVIFLPFLVLDLFKFSRTQILLLGVVSFAAAVMFAPVAYFLAMDFSTNHIANAFPGGTVYDLLYKVPLYYDGGGTTVSWLKMLLLVVLFGYAFMRLEDVTSNKLIFCFVVTCSIMALAISTSTIIFERFYHYGKAFAFLMTILFLYDFVRLKSLS